MPVPTDSDPLIQAIAAAIAAEDMDRVQALIVRRDREVRAIAEALGDSPSGRQRLLDLQRQQLALIELLRSRRDAVADELQTTGRIGKATRAYLSGSEP